jgi:hypothetical protein
MKIIVTICSNKKNTTSDELTAAKRYTSSRIKRVKSIAKRRGLPFFILSGKYGLIAKDEIVPYYDHLLSEDEVDAITLLVIKQVQSAAVTSIELYAKPREGNWIPYYRVLEEIAKELNINLFIKNLD